MRRWHPDKFLQKLGERIVEEEKEEVNVDDGKFNAYITMILVLSFSLIPW